MRYVEILESNNMVIKEGDTKDIFKLGLSYSDGTKPDLNNAIVNIFIADSEGVVVTKEMDIIDKGVVSFELTDDDVTGTGTLDAEIIVIYPDGKRETFPDTNYISFKVVPSIENRGEHTYIDHYEIIISRIEQLKTELESFADGLKDEVANSHSHALDSLSDVDITNVSSGQVLTFNGYKWVNGEGALQYILITDEEEEYLLSILDVNNSGTATVYVTDSEGYRLLDVDGNILIFKR